MKTIFTQLKTNKQFLILFGFVLITSFVNAAVRTASVSGNWNATGTWGGLSVPVAGDDVVIPAGFTVTVTANAVCLTLSINNSGSDGVTTSLIINSGNSLTVGAGTGTVSIGNATSMGNGSISTTSIIVNGTLTSGTINQNPSVRTVGGGGSGNTNLTINSIGVVNVTGNVAGTTASGSGFQATASVIFSGAGTLNLTGSFTTSIFTASTGTVNYNNNGTQSVRIDTYNNLSFSTSGTKTLLGAITINGNITIGTGSTLDISTSNFGITIDGNWTNTGTFTQRSGTVTFNGTGAQTINGSTTTFNNFSVNKSSGGLTLNVATTIAGILTLTNGIITTTSTNLLTLNAGASASFTNGSATSFVNGPMAKIGNTVFTFPVGKSGAGMRAIIISTSTDPATTFRGEFNRAAASNRGAVGAGITQVSACEHWLLDRTTGAGNVNVTLSWSSASPCNGALYVTNLSDLRVARYTGTQWVDAGNASTTGNNANGTITSNPVTTFSPFALAGSNSGTNPLPVKFTDVKAFERENTVQIEWTNQTESDLINYEIEKSLNGRDFSPISSIAARSNFGGKENYSGVDVFPVTGNNFYRIKAIEVSGKIIYSNVMKVVKGQKEQGLMVYPNPVFGSDITVNFSAPEGRYNVELFNSSGQLVIRKQINHIGGTVAQTISLPNGRNSGLYTLRIIGDNYSSNKMLIVQ